MDHRFVLGLAILCWVCVVSSCGDDDDASSSTDTDADTDADSDADSDTDADTDTDSDSDADTDSDADSDTDADTDTDADFDPYCAETCASPSDCVGANPTAITDADNYDCDVHCTYLGCLGDGECESTFPGLGYGCYEDGPFAPSCVKYCSVPADCELGISLYSADNYECDGGYCNWTGCNNDTECQEAMQDSTYTCESMTGYPYDNCQKNCNSPTDCVANGATAAYDADNYDCESNLCVYSGCNSDGECQSSFTADWECVD